METKIVFTDKISVDYGDVDLKPFLQLGKVEFYEYSSNEEMLERCHDADIIVTNKIYFGNEQFSQLPKLKLIALTATGYDNIDLVEARKHHVAVCNVAGYSSYAVAQHTLMFILNLATNFAKYNEAVHDGSWSKSLCYTLSTWPVSELRGKRVAILGLGGIGQKVAKLCQAFEMEVVAYQREGATYSKSSIPRLTLKEIAATADFVTVHLPLTVETNHLINEEFLKQMKPTAFLINMARGGLVDPLALKKALELKWIAGAAADVLEEEPPALDDQILQAPNLLLTPHTAWAPVEARTVLLKEVYQNLLAFQNGEKRNRVD